MVYSLRWKVKPQYIFESVTISYNIPYIHTHATIYPASILFLCSLKYSKSPINRLNLKQYSKTTRVELSNFMAGTVASLSTLRDCMGYHCLPWQRVKDMHFFEIYYVWWLTVSSIDDGHCWVAATSRVLNVIARADYVTHRSGRTRTSVITAVTQAAVVDSRVSKFLQNNARIINFYRTTLELLTSDEHSILYNYTYHIAIGNIVWNMNESIDCKLTRFEAGQSTARPVHGRWCETHGEERLHRGEVETPDRGDWIGTERKKNSVNEDSYNGNIYVRLIHDRHFVSFCLLFVSSPSRPFYGLKRFNYWSISFFLLIHPALFPTIPGLMAGALLFNHNY